MPWFPSISFKIKMFIYFSSWQLILILHIVPNISRLHSFHQNHSNQTREHQPPVNPQASWARPVPDALWIFGTAPVQGSSAIPQENPCFWQVLWNHRVVLWNIYQFLSSPGIWTVGKADYKKDRCISRSMHAMMNLEHIYIYTIHTWFNRCVWSIPQARMYMGYYGSRLWFNFWGFAWVVPQQFT